MTKIIQTNDTSGTGPRVVAVPGATGYAARYVASHLDKGAGETVSSWPATSAGDSLALVSSPSKLTVGDDGDFFVSSPGGASAGGRLLGPHLNLRPFTLAAVVKAGVGFTFLGLTGIEVGRNAAGAWYQKTAVSTVTTTNANSGWVLLFMNVHGDGTHSLTVDGVTTGKAEAGVAAAKYGGVYFGAPNAGQESHVREVVLWGRDLSKSDRVAASTYFHERYAGLG